MFTRIAFGKLTIEDPLDESNVRRAIEELRAKLRKIPDTAASSVFADAQLDGAIKARELAAAKLGEAEARRRSAELSEDAKRLASVQREVELCRHELSEAATVVRAAEEIAERRMRDHDATAKARDGEYLGVLRNAIIAERSRIEADLAKQMAVWSAKLAATVDAELAVAWSSVGTVRNYLNGVG